VLGNQHRDQEALDGRAEQAASAEPLERKPEHRRHADQHDHRDDAPVAPRGLAADFAIEPAVKERDGAAGQHHGMWDLAEDCRHIAEQRIYSEAADHEQQGVGTGPHHYAINLGIPLAGVGRAKPGHRVYVRRRSDPLEKIG